MIRRARLLAVVSTLLVGAVGTIASTQTWLTLVLADGASAPLDVPGASAVPVLAPLSLAVLALGGALSIVGRVLRVVFGALALVIAGVLGVLVAPLPSAPPVAALAATVTESTGIAGSSAIEALVVSTTATPWPFVVLAAQVVLAGAAVLTLVTAGRWGGGAERRYRTTAAVEDTGRPRDAIDSWDELSRGDDPTA